MLKEKANKVDVTAVQMKTSTFFHEWFWVSCTDIEQNGINDTH